MAYPKSSVFEWETWRFHEVIPFLGHLGLRWKLVLFAHFSNWGAKPSSFVTIPGFCRWWFLAWYFRNVQPGIQETNQNLHLPGDSK